MGEKRGMKALELWCKRVTEGYPGVKVENMTTSWRDGLAFCALIHHFRPDLIDFSSLKKNNIYVNNELAFRTAERHLGIPALLDAEDMVEYEVPDRLSILTYLSQFYQTFASHPSSPIKRSPDSSECSLVISSTASPSPTKEARRREACFVCGLPVFLAQRLLMGSHLYHRTCFRCARCSAQLTLANCYETQDGAYCCETCPDEEMGDEDISDKGGGPLSESPLPLYIAHEHADKTDSLVSSRTASLVALRRMMFENISHDTDDGKTPRSYEPSDGALKCDVTSVTPVASSGMISNSSSGPQCSQTSVVTKSDVDGSVSSEQTNLLSVSLDETNNCRANLVLTQNPLEVSSVTTEVDDKDEFSSLNQTDSSLIETENLNVINAQNKLDKDSSLEPDSYSSSVSIVPTKNDAISDSEDEIEYNKLVESKESIQKTVAEAINDVIAGQSEKEEIRSASSETGLFSHNESGSIEGSEEVRGEDEFISLTHNIEQLVIDAKNEDVINVAGSDTACKLQVPTPTTRVKHKPPTPQKRKMRKALISPKVEEKKPIVDYPEDLNPFGDDEEKEESASNQPSLNPFGSSDEEEEQGPKPAARQVVQAPKINLNPFWSDGEEEEEEESLPPVPKPRKLRTPQQSPEPSPQPRRLRSATGSMGSTTSIASRKKKPAPLPPNWQSPVTPSSIKTSTPCPPVPACPPPLPLSSTPNSRSSSPLFLDKDNDQFYSHQRKDSIVSETSSVGTIGSYTPHKSTYGQWKRKKGKAPPRPVPVRRQVQPMPLAAVRQELADIEIKQQGLERQGVKLEQTIRDKFEQEGASLTPYVEELVLQLFELVNEKNELFRRQAELMYLRRQHNLEEEHAELEYQIRCLMMCPERNKTDSDKAREEQLIQRLVEVVERRNEIIDCLEMDRLREKEEDSSVGTQLGIFSAAMGSELDLRDKSDKKGKKWKKDKKGSKKDGDESGEKKKSKRKWLLTRS